MKAHTFGAALALAAATVVAPLAQAAAPTITISTAWARPTAPGATTGGAYLVVTNRTAVADSLVSAVSPVAARIEFHSMSMVGGVMTMRPITPPIPLTAYGALRFAPGGSHLMLIGLKTPLKAGAHVPVTLIFARAGAVKVDLVVGEPPTVGGMAGMRM